MSSSLEQAPPPSILEKSGRNVGKLYALRYSKDEQAPVLGPLENILVDEIAIFLTAVEAKERCDKFYEFTKGFVAELQDCGLKLYEQTALKKHFYERVKEAVTTKKEKLSPEKEKFLSVFYDSFILSICADEQGDSEAPASRWCVVM
jgi:hypothetical protein